MTRRLVAFAFLFLIPFVWVCISWNYAYESLNGKYTWSRAGVTCVLRLHEDKTFAEEMTQGGKTRTAHGSWHRTGDRAVMFSYDLIPLVDGDSEIEGRFGKTFGLWPYLELGASHSVTLHRRLF